MTTATQQPAPTVDDAAPPDPAGPSAVTDAVILGSLVAVAGAVTTVVAGGTLAVALAQLTTDIGVQRTKLLNVKADLATVVTNAQRQAASTARRDLAGLGIRRPILPFMSRANTEEYLRAVDEIASNLHGEARRLFDRATWQGDLDAAERELQRAVTDGAFTVQDRRGRRWQPAPYVRWSTRSAVRETQLQTQSSWLLANGITVVAVTTRAGSCSLCTPWEGELLALTGTPGQRRVPVRDNVGALSLVSITGTVAEARAAGLLHPNCRHALRPWLPGAVVDRTVLGGPEHGNAKARTAAAHVRHWRQRRAAAITPVGKARADRHIRYWRNELRATQR